MARKRRSRRWLLRSTGTALAAVAGAGVTSGDTGDQASGAISLSNGSYDIDLGPIGTTVQSGQAWTYGEFNTLYQEQCLLREGAGAFFSSSSVLSPFPSQGQPGQQYTATTEYAGTDTNLSLERGVQMSPDEPSFEVSYAITNVGGSAVNDLRFYQYVDYDIGDPSDSMGRTHHQGDEGEVDPDAGYVVQEDQNWASGFVATVSPDTWDLANPLQISQRLSQGSLQETQELSGDVVAALRWDLGSLSAGSTATHSITFAAGGSRSEVLSTLPGVSAPSSDLLSGFGVGAAAGGIGGAYAYSRLRGDDSE